MAVPNTSTFTLQDVVDEINPSSNPFELAAAKQACKVFDDGFISFTTSCSVNVLVFCTAIISLVFLT